MLTIVTILDVASLWLLLTFPAMRTAFLLSQRTHMLIFRYPKSQVMKWSKEINYPGYIKRQKYDHSQNALFAHKLH